MQTKGEFIVDNRTFLVPIAKQPICYMLKQVSHELVSLQLCICTSMLHGITTFSLSKLTIYG